MRPVVIATIEWTDTAWQADAACVVTDVGFWYAPDGRTSDPTRERRAKAICAGCPVVEECLDWALTVDDRHAILGGTTPDERKRMRRNRRRQARRLVP